MDLLLRSVIEVIWTKHSAVTVAIFLIYLYSQVLKIKNCCLRPSVLRLCAYADLLYLNR
jgi:hypothetical protein